MIFRDKALRRYSERRERAIFPKLASPRILLSLWILFCLLVIALVTAWLTRVPVYAHGTAVEIERASDTTDGPIKLVAVLPAASFSDLRPGQKAFVRWNERRGLARGEVSEILPTLLTSAEIKSRFKLNVETTAQPKTVALVSLAEGAPEEGPQRSFLEALTTALDCHALEGWHLSARELGFMVFRLVQPCDGVVTGIQRIALAGDIATYRSIKNPQ